MVDIDQFLTDRGRIRFRRVAEVGVGAVVAAIFSGIASVILGIGDFVVELLDGLSSFGGTVVGIVAGLPAVTVERGFLGAATYVLDAGPGGFVLAIGIVLLTTYTVAEVVSRVR